MSHLPVHQNKVKALALYGVAAFAAFALTCNVAIVVFFSTGARESLCAYNSTRTTTTATTRTRTMQTKGQVYNIPKEVDIGIANTVENVTRAGVDADAHYNPLFNCSVTSQVQIHIPLEQSSPQKRWILQAVDRFGRAKTVGGDEFYITYYSRDNWNNMDHSCNTTCNRSSTHPTAVALITDRQDGTYELEFVTPPQLVPAESTSNATIDNATMPVTLEKIGEMGVLKVDFLYTCGIGHAFNPMKEAWMVPGNTFTFHTGHVPTPPMRQFVPPRSDVDLAMFNKTIFFGDSLIRELSIVGEGGRNERGFSYRTNPNMQLSQSNLDNWLHDLETWHGVELRGGGANGTKMALITGSSAWDIMYGTELQGLHFGDHLSTIRRLVQVVRAHYPKVTLLWKLPAALVRWPCNVSINMSSQSAPSAD